VNLDEIKAALADWHNPLSRYPVPTWLAELVARVEELKGERDKWASRASALVHGEIKANVSWQGRIQELEAWQDRVADFGQDHIDRCRMLSCPDCGFWEPMIAQAGQEVE
jgi:hypothetical protein